MSGPFKMKGHTLPGIKQRKKTDMSKLRSKQARASKGISEWQHFKDSKSQGDEPRVEGTWGGKKKLDSMVQPFDKKAAEKLNKMFKPKKKKEATIGNVTYTISD